MCNSNDGLEVVWMLWPPKRNFLGWDFDADNEPARAIFYLFGYAWVIDRYSIPEAFSLIWTDDNSTVIAIQNSNDGHWFRVKMS